jgi:protein MAK16
MPNKAWEAIRLDKSYAKALEQIDQHIEYWPKFMIHKCKQRLTKLRQMLNRIRRLKLKGLSEITTIKKKTERRDKIREKKAEIAANIETSIEQELLDRLKEGTYGEIYNYNPKIFEKIMEEQEVEGEGEEVEDEESIDDEAFIFDPNEIGDSDEDDDDGLNFGQPGDDLGDIEDAIAPSKGKSAKRKPTKKIGKKFGEKPQKKLQPIVELEYEYENQEEAQNN